MPKSLHRSENVKLIGRKAGEFWFVESVFDHGDGLAGCIGMIVHPVSEDDAKELLSLDNLEERFGDCWEDRFKDDVDEGCEECDDYLNEDGCDTCRYPSLRDFCSVIAVWDGINAVINKAGDEYVDALNAIGEDAKYADISDPGRIFGRGGRGGPMTPAYFDEVYDKKALTAILAYEDGDVNYEYAVKVVFG